MSQINYTVDRVVRMKDDGQVVRFIKGSIKSTDTKPTIGIYDRSTLYEEDTGNYYVFNQRLNKWQLHDPDDGDNEGNEGSDGGSDSGTSNDCKVMTIGYSTYDNENEIYVLDHTWQEIYDALESGKIVYLVYNDQANNAIDINTVNSIWINPVDNSFWLRIDGTRGFSAESASGYPVLNNVK